VQHGGGDTLALPAGAPSPPDRTRGSERDAPCGRRLRGHGTHSRSPLRTGASSSVSALALGPGEDAAGAVGAAFGPHSVPPDCTVCASSPPPRSVATARPENVNKEFDIGELAPLYPIGSFVCIASGADFFNRARVAALRRPWNTAHLVYEVHVDGGFDKMPYLLTAPWLSPCPQGFPSCCSILSTCGTLTVTSCSRRRLCTLLRRFCCKVTWYAAAWP
jgi:hypothetical protein